MNLKEKDTPIRVTHLTEGVEEKIGDIVIGGGEPPNKWVDIGAVTGEAGKKAGVLVSDDELPPADPILPPVSGLDILENLKK